MATIGKNILENLTTGMYSDSKVSYREYIQNACDQIDRAIRQGIISEDDAEVDIFIDPEKRYISTAATAEYVKVTFKASLARRSILRVCPLARLSENSGTNSPENEDKGVMG